MFQDSQPREAACATVASVPYSYARRRGASWRLMTWRWKYCAAAGTGIGIHQLRHAHATELNRGVSIEAVRKRLGHSSTDTVMIYAELADRAADAGIRAALRKRETRR